MMQNVELLASDTILEAPIGEVEVGGNTYTLMPPTTATLIAVSGLISLLPEINRNESSENVLKEVLDKAQDCGELLGQIAATLILGEKRILEKPMIDIEVEASDPLKRWRWSKPANKRKIAVFERDHLASQIVQGFTPGAISRIILSALSTDAIADFFVLTASLSTKNILAKTQTEAETTASGHSS